MSAADEPLGMYRLRDEPEFPRVTIGSLTLCRQRPGKIWIEGEEGGEFDEALLEAHIMEFFNKHF